MDSYSLKTNVDNVFAKLQSGSHYLYSPGEYPLNLVIMNGEKGCRLMIDESDTMFLSPNSLFMAGRNTSIFIAIPDGGSVILHYFDYVGKTLDRHFLSIPQRAEISSSKSFSILPMNDGLKGYFMAMNDSLSALFDDIAFRDLKHKELFFILSQGMDQNALADFLNPALSWHDPDFRRKVLQHFEKSYRVKTLAYDCGYPERVFVKKFKAEFGVSPGAWINEQVRNSIKVKLSNPDLTLQQIADELNMSSLQSFSRYCKNNFGMPPSKIRDSLIDNRQNEFGKTHDGIW